MLGSGARGGHTGGPGCSRRAGSDRHTRAAFARSWHNFSCRGYFLSVTPCVLLKRAESSHLSASSSVVTFCLSAWAAERFCFQLGATSQVSPTRNFASPLAKPRPRPRTVLGWHGERHASLLHYKCRIDKPMSSWQPASRDGDHPSLARRAPLTEPGARPHCETRTTCLPACGASRRGCAMIQIARRPVGSPARVVERARPMMYA